MFAVMLVLCIVGIGWLGMRALRTGRTAAVPAAAHAPAPQVTHAQAPSSAVSTSNAARTGVATTASLALHEVIPDVPLSARRTIRGHVKVWVRVIIDNDGTVFAAVADRAGPSKYFERLAIEAAKKWTFSPSSAPSQRLAQIHFEFTRDGTTGHAVPLR